MGGFEAAKGFHREFSRYYGSGGNSSSSSSSSSCGSSSCGSISGSSAQTTVPPTCVGDYVALRPGRPGLRLLLLLIVFGSCYYGYTVIDFGRLLVLCVVLRPGL